MGFVLESRDLAQQCRLGAKLGYSPQQLDALNRARDPLLVEVRDALETPALADRDQRQSRAARRRLRGRHVMTADAAQALHAHQVNTFADTEADMVTAFTMT